MLLNVPVPQHFVAATVGPRGIVKGDKILPDFKMLFVTWPKQRAAQDMPHRTNEDAISDLHEIVTLLEEGLQIPLDVGRSRAAPRRGGETDQVLLCHPERLVGLQQL